MRLYTSSFQACRSAEQLFISNLPQTEPPYYVSTLKTFTEIFWELRSVSRKLFSLAPLMCHVIKLSASGLYNCLLRLTDFGFSWNPTKSAISVAEWF